MGDGSLSSVTAGNPNKPSSRPPGLSPGESHNGLGPPARGHQPRRGDGSCAGQLRRDGSPGPRTILAGTIPDDFPACPPAAGPLGRRHLRRHRRDHARRSLSPTFVGRARDLGRGDHRLECSVIRQLALSHLRRLSWRRILGHVQRPALPELRRRVGMT